MRCVALLLALCSPHEAQASQLLAKPISRCCVFVIIFVAITMNLCCFGLRFLVLTDPLREPAVGFWFLPRKV